MSTSVTTIQGKRCTAVRVNDVGEGQEITTSSPSNTSTFVVSTLLSSSPIDASTTPTATPFLQITLPLNAVPPNTVSNGVTLPSSARAASSQSQIQSATTVPPPSAISTSASSTAPLVFSSLATESFTDSIATPVLDSATTVSLRTSDRESTRSPQTNNRLASTTASDLTAGDTDTGAPATTTTTTITTTGAGAGAGTEQIGPANDSSGLVDGAQTAPSSRMSTQRTAALVGGVVGGLVAIFITAGLLWFFRKRIMRKRRSTLLTPLSTDNAYSRGEKDSYVISRSSLGPSSIPEKAKAIMCYYYQRVRGRVNNLMIRSPKPSVDLNRGNSQFGLPGASTNHPSAIIAMSGIEAYPDMSDETHTGQGGTQPIRPGTSDMDNRRQEQKQRVGTVAGGSNPRRSQSLQDEHFLGSQLFKFGTENPFADSNVRSHNAAKPMPFAASAAPGSAGVVTAVGDSNDGGRATSRGNRGPTTYVQNARRSRGLSISTSSASMYGTGMRMPSVYHELNVSAVTSDDTRRNRFRSDPFDLDRPELLVRSSRSGERGPPRMPRQTHARAESFTSKYSSGACDLDWTDPGPDVGPAAGRRDTPNLRTNAALGLR
ncbi:hypothetical protein GGS20DRAFT_549924 [Poronia punctata]|nr:hypothetical protein GGS20DRAFT_549924 [Poronia punctata]